MNSIKAVSYNPYSTEYSHFLADNVTHYESFVESVRCWFLSFFGRTILVHDQEHNKSFYIRIQDLVSHLCKTPYSKISETMLAISPHLNRLALEALHPFLGEKVSSESVCALFSKFRSLDFLCQLDDSRDIQTSIQAASAQFEKLKSLDSEILNFNKDTLLNNLKPGDILFKKLPHDSKNTVVFGQWLLSPLLTGKQEREAYKYSHAMIYLGDGKFAEATPNHGKSEVRTFDIKDPKFALESSSPIQYVVARHKDADLARQAAEIASTIAQNCACSSGIHDYDYVDALRSIYLPSNFGLFARYRYNKQFYLDRRGEPPTEFFGTKDFFCTYFVGYSYQTAESRKVMPQIQEPDDAPIKGSNVFYPLIRALWGFPRVIWNWASMSEKVELQFDAKRLTPEDFRNFMVTHPGIFRDCFLIRAENAPAIISELSQK